MEGRGELVLTCLRALRFESHKQSTQGQRILLVFSGRRKVIWPLFSGAGLRPQLPRLCCHVHLSSGVYQKEKAWRKENAVRWEEMTRAQDSRAPTMQVLPT